MQKSFRKELENFKQDAIDVGATIKSVNNLIIAMQNSIFNLMIDEEKDEVLKSAYDLIQFYNKNSNDKGILYIANDKEVDDLKTLKRDEPTKVNIKITQVPHQLARFILENISTEYTFKGRDIGQSEAFPESFKAQSVVEIPKFLTGQQDVLYKNIKWIRVVESKGFDFKYGYDRYAAIYVPNGLSMSSYNKIGDRFKDKIKELFKSG